MYTGDHPGVYGHQERYEHRRAQEVALSVVVGRLEPTVVEALREGLEGLAVRVAPSSKGHTDTSQTCKQLGECSLALEVVQGAARRGRT